MEGVSGRRCSFRSIGFQDGIAAGKGGNSQISWWLVSGGDSVNVLLTERMAQSWWLSLQ